MKKTAAIISFILTMTGIPAFAAPAAMAPVTPTADSYITTENAKKKIFMQIGALESVENDKYLLRKVADHLEFYFDDNTKVFSKTHSDQSSLRQWQYVVVKGPANGNSVIANSIYVFNDIESYNETKNDEDDKKNTDKGLQGTIVRAMSDSDEYERMKEEYGKGIVKELKSEISPTPTPVAFDASGLTITAALQKPIRPFYIKLADGSVLRVLHDEKTYWVFIEKKNRSDIKIGDRLKLYFDKRITVRYKSYPIKVIIENALGQY